MTLIVGKPAPDFSLPDGSDHVHSLRHYRGSWVLLYFYPRDNTPGCTTEACRLRDSWAEFTKLSAVVLGVSTDTVASHKKFVDKFSLPFPVLADIDKKVVTAYQVWGEKKFMGRTYHGTKRMSFLIDPRGRLVKIYSSVKPAEHADEVLADIRAFLS